MIHFHHYKVNEDTNNVSIFKKCLCGRLSEVKVSRQQFHALQRLDRPFIQDILPDHSPDDCEILISGTCAKCWDELFEEEE